MLVWIVTPALTGLLLRTWGGDGWRDAGLKFRIIRDWPSYVGAVFLFPSVSLAILAFDLMVGAFSLAHDAKHSPAAFALLVVGGLAASFVKNVFEEFAWRGYLTGCLNTIGIAPLSNHLVTGITCALWHLPYWLFFLDVSQLSTMSRPAFAAFGALVLVITAITYGELRLWSQSVWPGVLLHSMANAITLPSILNSFVQFQDGSGPLLSPGNDGIVHSALFATVGLFFYGYRIRVGTRNDLQMSHR